MISNDLLRRGLSRDAWTFVPSNLLHWGLDRKHVYAILWLLIPISFSKQFLEHMSKKISNCFLPLSIHTPFQKLRKKTLWKILFDRGTRNEIFNSCQFIRSLTCETNAFCSPIKLVKLKPLFHIATRIATYHDVRSLLCHRAACGTQAARGPPILRRQYDKKC